MENDVIEFLQESNFIENERTSQALNEAIKAWKFIIKHKELSKENILKCHKILMKTRDISFELKGAWRHPIGNLTGNVRVGGKSKQPFYAVPSLMEEWIQAVNNSLISKYVETQEQKEGTVVAMHINFENIHPFIDGNGRMGRILMNWQLQRFGLSVKVIKEKDKQSYYDWFK